MKISGEEADLFLSPSQLWWLDGSMDDAPYWIILAGIECRYPLDFGTLRRAIVEVCQDHEAFRFRLVRTDGQWQGLLSSESEVPIEYSNLGDLTAEEQDHFLDELEHEMIHTIDSFSGPVARFQYIDFGESRSPILWISINHLVSDNHSILALLRQIDLTYRQMERGTPRMLDSTSAQLATWSARLREMSMSHEVGEEVKYWPGSIKNVKFGLIPRDPLADNDRQEAAHFLTVSRGLEEIRNTRRQEPVVDWHNRDLFVRILVALGLTVQRATDEQQSLIYLVSHGRSRQLHGLDVRDTLACMFHSYPFGLAVPESEDSAACDRDEAVRDQLVQVPRQGIVYDLVRYLTPNTIAAQDLKALPEPEIVLSFRGRIDLSSVGIFSGVNDRCTGPRAGATKKRRQLIQIDCSIWLGRLVANFAFSGSVEVDVARTLASNFASNLG